LRLYDYWRSSAAYRVRIALELKGLACEHVPIDLRAGAQIEPSYRKRNPQGLVPFLEDGPVGIGQSLAIIEYLEERYPAPALLPSEPAARAHARSLALLVACEIHPLNNLRVLNHLRHGLGLDQPAVRAWYAHWIGRGFEALEDELARSAGRFCVGEEVTIADVCLVPQVANARRYACDLGPFPTIRRIDETCRALPAFARARPEVQPGAPPPGP
jgi:maleylpyruvate isomerase